MAVAFTLVTSTPHFLRYKITSAGAEAGNLDAASAATPDLITDSQPGPLRAVLSATYANQAAARAAILEGSRMRVGVLTRTGAALWAVDANVNGSALRLTATAAAADAVGSYLDIEFAHSIRA